MEKKPFFTIRSMNIVLAVICLLAAACIATDLLRQETPADVPPEQPEDSPAVTVPQSPEEREQEDPPPPEEVFDLTYENLTIGEERLGYARGDLRLVIPRISFDKPVSAGTTPEDLELSPGLYDYAQLPGEGNRNTSIAGHRYKRDFYYVDTVTDKDYLYLVDAAHVYRYIFESNFVIDPYDWAPIHRQGYSCLTLTTCTPIGISDHRLVVRGTLDAILPYAEDFPFKMSAPEIATRADVLKLWLDAAGLSDADRTAIMTLHRSALVSAALAAPVVSAIC